MNLNNGRKKVTEPYGKTFDNRPRFDLEPGHSAERPALRRIASPVEISDTYLDVMRNNRALDALAEIFSPNIKFENAKINSKQPGTATEVKFHQDFLFEAHTNDDMMTVLFFIDDVTEENGPLEVVPGTHKGPLYEHWHDGVFTGTVSDDVTEKMKSLLVPCYGPAGSACLMHTRLLHGSGPNLSDKPRTLYICEYTAEDCYPLHPNHIPSEYMYEVVRGNATGRVRCSEYEMAFPEMPSGASFFEQQAKAN
jgi:ectoine hydroxylase-related dioxygenase (phytanoyl-CoA dioxygenase family)